MIIILHIETGDEAQLLLVIRQAVQAGIGFAKSNV
jgi:hypothetical protein